MATEFLQGLYASDMRFFRDNLEVKISGRWYWCKPNAKVLPIPHTFGSFAFDGRECELWERPGVGEIRPNRPQTRKAATIIQFDGDHYCGKDEDWLEGCKFSEAGTLPVNINGLPLCCLTSDPTIEGGQADDGSATITIGGLYGGQADDGEGLARPVGWLFGHGGQSDDGSAFAGNVVLFSGEGGQSDDGEGLARPVGWLFGHGGQSDDGSAFAGNVVPLPGEGGQSDDGSAFAGNVVLFSGDGGQSDDGEATIVIEGSIVVPCWPDPLPAILYLTFVTGGMGLPSDIPMTWNPTHPRGAGWYTEEFNCSGNMAYFRLICSYPLWDISAWIEPYTYGSGTLTPSGPPFALDGIPAFSLSCVDYSPLLHIEE